jgi:hypothetical protein
VDELGELDPIVAALHAHVAAEALPDGIVRGAEAVARHPPLRYEPRVELRVMLGDRTHHRALAAVQAQADLRVPDLPLDVRHLWIPSSLV